MSILCKTNKTITNSNYSLASTTQILLGVDWACCLYRKYRIRFGVAYEVQFWWNQTSNNSIPQALFINSPTSNLMMHGLTLQANF